MSPTERAGAPGDRFGPARPAEAVRTYEPLAAAVRSDATGTAVGVGG